MKLFTALLFLALSLHSCSQPDSTEVTSSKKCNKNRAIVFYNVENLFDTIDAPDKNDAEFLPDGKKKWDSKKYNTKIQHINEVFNSISNPLIIGLCEIENEQVVIDIVKGGNLKNTHAVVHTESPDQRGIDNAIIYDSTVLTLEEDGVVKVIYEESGRPTRDILWAKFSDGKESFYVMVNHWPSRYGGQEKSNHKRVAAASAAYGFIDLKMGFDTTVQIVFMGDLNDYPENDAPKKISKKLHPMITAESGEFGGTHNYRGEWGVLDHIMVSPGFMKRKGIRVKKKSGVIHSFDYLIGEYKGNKVPARTYGGGKYLDGYSDHLPVSIKVKL